MNPNLREQEQVMNVRKGSKVGLLFSDGATVDYEVRETVSLDHLISTLQRLALLEGDMRPKSTNQADGSE